MKEIIPRFDCKTCDKYTTCTTLCAAAKKYANQDYKRKDKKEVLSGVIGYNPSGVKLITKSNEEMIMQMFFIDHIRITQIAKMIDVSQPYVTKIVKKYQAIIVKNLKK